RDAAGHTKAESSAGGVFLNPDSYDLNDDGVFDVADYAGDARVSDANGNGLLDPQDLIRAFSDGTDADANGYVDDIAGWNFLDDDNDRSTRCRTGTAPERRGTPLPRPTTAATSGPAPTAWSCPSASATASSPTRISSRRASCSPSTAAHTSSRRPSAR